jgi:hypothetical protein
MVQKDSVNCILLFFYSGRRAGSRCTRNQEDIYRNIYQRELNHSSYIFFYQLQVFNGGRMLFLEFFNTIALPFMDAS